MLDMLGFFYLLFWFFARLLEVCAWVVAYSLLAILWIVVLPFRLFSQAEQPRRGPPRRFPRRSRST